MLRYRRLVLPLWLTCWSASAFGDDLADEAELHFENGALAYQRGEYKTALERFLLSNRLVPNRNVIFNIARCFEQLGKYAEAFRYYDLARQGETDPAVLSSIDAQLQHIAAKVAVLNVTSDPPGATIYIERRDLGPRGVTPRRLAVTPGHYRVIAELPGYHSANVETGELALGASRELHLALAPVLGKVVIGGDPGTRVRADDAATGPTCSTPCTLELPLGPHPLYLSRDEHYPQQLTVEVTPARVANVTPRLERQTGGIVIDTDEPNALVEIDGTPKGFTPAIVTLPVGTHQMRISLEGFKPVERRIQVLPEQQTKINLALVLAEQVEGASRRVESVEDTPSSVSIVPQAEISALAYPTLAESLRGLPGVYFWDDRGYIGIGLRGLGRLNSYGNRVLVLMDGVPTNDNWIGSSYLGYDAMTDLADVERVELIRGPGSAVYGTGAFSGVINVIMRREATTGAEAGISTSLDGVSRARVRANLRSSAKTGLYASAAIGQGPGRDFHFPELAAAQARPLSPELATGSARGLDGMKSATLHGRAHHGLWTVQWSWHRHEKHLPNAPFETTFGDPRTKQLDERGLIELRAEPRLSVSTTSVSSVTLNRYRFHGDYARSLAVGLVPVPALVDGLETDTFHGHWVTFGERVVHQFSSNWSATLGGEASWHFDVEQRVTDASGTLLDSSKPYRVIAGYGIVDGRFGSRVHLSLGSRVDNYTTFGTSLNPRVGLVIRPYQGGNTKLTLGRAFRAPSTYELYYNDGGTTQVPSPHLTPETIYSGEVEHSHRFSSTVLGSVAAYANTIRGLIDLSTNAQGRDQFMVSPRPIVAVGTEIGLRRDWRSGWMASLYYGYTRAFFLKDEAWSTLVSLNRDRKVHHVSNSPIHAATFKAVAPFLVRGLNLGTRITLEDGRWDRFESAKETQRKTDAAVFWDLVLSAEDARHHLRTTLGVYNVFDWRYQYPLGREAAYQRTISSYGRSLLLSLDGRF